MTNVADDDSPRRVIVLGSTGSIGGSTLEVIDHLGRPGGHGRPIRIVGLAAGSRAGLLAEQARRFGVEDVAVADETVVGDLRDVPRVYAGPAAARELVDAVARPGDLVVGAMVGVVGLPATLAAIERGCDVALANKETLVAAGELVMPLVAQKGVSLRPVDSEHSAIAQCLRAGRTVDEVRRLVLTASGGPFRQWAKADIDRATREQALAHPTWKMGPKVTIDSATMMNKALEIIEAHRLFGLCADRIDVIIHPQSIVHSFVEFIDGSVIAQLGPPDMRTPIQCALTWPDRVEGCSKRLDWNDLSQLDFEPVDHERFPAVRMAYGVIAAGGAAGAVFNAANEAAVAAFLAGEVRFGDIATLVAAAIAEVRTGPVRGLDDVLAADAAARAFVRDRVGAREPVGPKM